jgi:hypothetical protein
MELSAYEGSKGAIKFPFEKSHAPRINQRNGQIQGQRN